MTIPATIFALLLSLMPACPTEDSTNCGWDAQAQGNHRGQSFVSLGPLTIGGR
ncbi:MAG: hypothetical protein Q8K33_01605 [Cypionkella sp.]|uniref:hypothetical protein n=1 Tax=Cypionkella sp. TaxID=2811411 RepID=UPI00272F809E|nr:hypothetical protein [Cypionkella sp.]MDP2047577.1 hypothetical protein [Cypionkella sp.]